MSNYKKVFCSFGDSRLQKSLKRIKDQAVEMNAYDKIFIYDETFLDTLFQNKFSDKLKPGCRGFGYWCWKPQVILQTLEKMDEGDILQYSDSGCHLNKNGRDRLLQYFDIAKNSNSGILSFRTKHEHELCSGESFYANYEYKYNKADLLQYFNVLNDRRFTHTVQYEAGIIFIRKEKFTVEFIKRWIATFSENFGFIDDSPSKIPNLDGFIDHRHDQSIYSILCKINGVKELFSSEYYVEGDWSQLENYPIWVKRDMDFGLAHRIKRKIKSGLKYFIAKFS
ncbi:hypothetical protein [Solitalea koreensis]|uniref:Nucleotide-diphospho-sugar transferase domain-containing protein n=1 Tax=Solitalea koreensis TaxID=543615 RepID=A0A521CQ18_9SPHI|nr:hypothetical protein [Solitalea koreensis]SMO61506.1 hypothetical protein SAMN06265350_104255 [Solitalea koreensis]